MKLDVTYQNDKISFTHLKKKNIRHVYLSIDKAAGVIVKSGPRFSADDAKRLVLEKAEWVRAKLATVDSIISPLLPPPEKLDTLFLGGRRIPVRFVADADQSRIRLIEETDAIVIRHHPEKCDRILPNIESFYRRKTEAVVLPLVKAISETMDLYPRAVSFKKYKRRWGCCDNKNRIVFNTLLAQFPEEVIRYIVVHELAHIKEKNHSPRFWKLVEAYKPDYRAIHRQIKGL